MNRSLGAILLNFAVALYLLATGLLGFTDRGSRSSLSEIRNAVESLFNRGDFSNILVAILSVLAIIAGVFILLKFFGQVFPFTELVLIILAIVWIVLIIMIDIVAPLNARNVNFIDWMKNFGAHVMVLGGIVLATERFGG